MEEVILSSCWVGRVVDSALTSWQTAPSGIVAMLGLFALALILLMKPAYSFSLQKVRLMVVNCRQMLPLAGSPEEHNLPDGCKVFIGNLPFDASIEGDVSEMIRKEIGLEFVHMNVPKGKKSKRPFGFMFVDFKDPDSAMQCVEFVDGLQYGDRVLNSNIKYNDENSPIPKTKDPFDEDKSIRIVNLDYTLSEEEIFSMCEDIVGHGKTRRVKLPLDKETGRTRGFGYVEFMDPSIVMDAISNLNGLEVLDRELKVSRLIMKARKTEIID